MGIIFIYLRDLIARKAGSAQGGNLLYMSSHLHKKKKHRFSSRACSKILNSEEEHLEKSHIGDFKELLGNFIFY